MSHKFARFEEVQQTIEVITEKLQKGTMTDEEAAIVVYGKASGDSEDEYNDQNDSGGSSEGDEEVAVAGPSKVSSS